MSLEEILTERGYKLIKEYPNFILCQRKSGIRECFNLSDLGLIDRTMLIREGTHKG